MLTSAGPAGLHSRQTHEWFLINVCVLNPATNKHVDGDDDGNSATVTGQWCI